MKGKNLFFICIITVIYLVSGVVIVGSSFQKQKKESKQEDSNYVEEIAENYFQKPQEQTKDEYMDYGKESTEERKTFITELSKEEMQNSESEKKEGNKGLPGQKTEQKEEKEDLDTVSVNIWKEEPVGKEYFADALFIGDSRTVGLKEYGDLKGAVFFADSGMSVFELWKKKLPVFSEGKVSFEEVLYDKKYGKIYLMLGINELGYQFENIQKKYQETLEKIREIQKDAIIYLCANLHITEEHSRKDEIYNNENVNRVNEMILQMADNKSIFYIDVNELFDDETGSLSTEYSSDSFHVYGKYYMKWVEWLCTKAV